jgi:hypothetical protein
MLISVALGRGWLALRVAGVGWLLWTAMRLLETKPADI